MNKKVIFTDRSVKSVDLLLKEISKYPILSQEEEYSLWERMQEGRMAARERLICCNMRYVVTMAKRYLWSGIALEDLINTGAIGLTLAADRFDASREIRFLSYAVWYIDCELKKAVTGNWPYLRLASLDDPLDEWEEEYGTLLDLVANNEVKAPDWAMAYFTELAAMKERVRKKHFDEAASIFEEVVGMKEKGLSFYDVAKKHGVSENDIKNLWNLIRKDLKDFFLEAA